MTQERSYLFPLLYCEKRTTQHLKHNPALKIKHTHTQAYWLIRVCSIAQELNVCPHSLNKTHSVETNMALHPFVCACVCVWAGFCEVNTCMAFFSFGNTLWASKICSRKWHFIWIQVMLCWACLCSFACMTVCVHISQKEGLGGGGV